MSNQRIALGVGLCLGLLCRTVCLRAEDGPASGLTPPAPSGATNLLPSLPAVAHVATAPAFERDILVAIPKVFAELERAPVRFNHDKHTAALEREGCQHCHPQDDKGAQLFTFPKVRDESSAKALLNAFHDACLGCHQQRAAANQPAGPATCGECHRAEPAPHRQAYAPVFPEFYSVLRDTYHKDCLVCHGESGQPVKHAAALDWKSFYVKEQRRAAAAWPRVAFDYVVHAKHEKALEKKCQLCHYLAPERRQQLAAAGKEPTGKDWLQDLDPAHPLTERKKTAHALCINCHLTRQTEKKQGGPVYCGSCHSGQQRPLEQIAQAPRPVCEQKEKMLIALKEGARAKAVPFNHQTHEATSRSCQECHHQTLRACSSCHTVQGSQEGGGVTLAEAYHKPTSTWSCIGCHEVVKQQPACAGCHDRLERGLVESACTACHTGSLTNLETIARLPAPQELLPPGTKDEITIAALEKEYQPSKMPHLAIAKKLTDISNESKLASYFHRDKMTICAGCHHRAPLEKKTSTPSCATCHPVRLQTEQALPTLLGAYHQQCLGCHQQMVQTPKKLPQSCTGCHEQKPQPKSGAG